MEVYPLYKRGKKVDLTADTCRWNMAARSQHNNIRAPIEHERNTATSFTTCKFATHTFHYRAPSLKAAQASFGPIKRYNPIFRGRAREELSSFLPCVLSPLSMYLYMYLRPVLLYVLKSCSHGTVSFSRSATSCSGLHTELKSACGAEGIGVRTSCGLLVTAESQ